MRRNELHAWTLDGTADCRAARFAIAPTAARPSAIPYAERFVRSIKHECLNQVIPFGERHLRRTIAEFVAHYHRERNHQELGNRLIIEDESGVGSGGPIQCRQRLGGMLNYYYRQAA